MAKIKERIYFNKNDKALAALNELRNMQVKLDSKKKELRALQFEARSLSQKIPDKIRRWNG